MLVKRVMELTPRYAASGTLPQLQNRELILCPARADAARCPLSGLQLCRMRSCLDLCRDVQHLPLVPRHWQLYHHRGMGEGQSSYSGPQGQDQRDQVSLCTSFSVSSFPPRVLVAWISTDLNLPQSIGIIANLKSVLGPNPLLWLVPQKMQGDGLSFPVNPDAGGESASEWADVTSRESGRSVIGPSNGHPPHDSDGYYATSGMVRSLEGDERHRASRPVEELV